MEPWNDLAVRPPPINTILYLNLKNVQNLSHTCKNVINVLSKQSPLHMESAILSRFLYKFDQKFRNDIGYRNLKKVNTALRRYLILNLLKEVQNFNEVLNNSHDKYYPTRQMLEYIMIRIMSFSKIMIRICVCSKQASVYYMNRVKRGESHWMSLMPYALTSRIWTMSTVLLQHSCSWYSNLFPYLEKLEYQGLDFLPKDYLLPTNLGDWLDVNNVDNLGRFKWSHKKNVGNINLNFTEDDEMNFDNILNYVKDINDGDDTTIATANSTTSKSHSETLIETVPFAQDFDQGEAISREYFQSFFKNKPVKNDEKNIHSADNVTSKTALDTFLLKEENYRNEESDLSLTKHLSFMQWQSIRASLVSLGDSLANNRKIERKFKKIWKDKCLDYL